MHPPETSAITTSAITSSPIGPAELVERLLRTAHQYRRAQFGALDPLGLTPAQERTLRLIARADGPIRMGVIAERMGVVPRSVTPLVDALEEAGLVQRTIDPSSRRSILLTLTDAGKGVQDLLIEVRREAGDKLFATLSEGEREELARLLDKVAAQLVPRDDCASTPQTSTPQTPTPQTTHARGTTPVTPHRNRSSTRGQ